MQVDVGSFLAVLDPADTTTGGGTASALAGAMAAALVAMVARLPAPLERPGPEEFFRELGAEAEALSSTLLGGAAEDAAAFSVLRAAYRLPKRTPEEQAERSRAVQQAVLRAAQVPLDNAERCQRVLEMCAALTGRSNPSAASDLECAAHLGRAGLLGCLANVEVNLPLLKNERELVRLTGRVRELRESATGVE
jgi:formiminotetrahydrofolate cyclodeaminase